MSPRDDHPLEQISALLDGDLDGATSRAVEEHLAACPRCRAAAEDLRSIRRAIAAEPVPQVPDRLVSRIASLLSKADQAPAPEPLPPGRTRRKGPVPLPARVLRLPRLLPWTFTAAGTLAASAILAVVLLREAPVREALVAPPPRSGDGVELPDRPQSPPEPGSRVDSTVDPTSGSAPPPASSARTAAGRESTQGLRQDSPKPLAESPRREAGSRRRAVVPAAPYGPSSESRSDSRDQLAGMAAEPPASPAPSATPGDRAEQTEPSARERHPSAGEGETFSRTVEATDGARGATAPASRSSEGIAPEGEHAGASAERRLESAGRQPAPGVDAGFAPAPPAAPLQKQQAPIPTSVDPFMESEQRFGLLDSCELLPGSARPDRVWIAAREPLRWRVPPGEMPGRVMALSRGTGGLACQPRSAEPVWIIEVPQGRWPDLLAGLRGRSVGGAEGLGEPPSGFAFARVSIFAEGASERE